MLQAGNASDREDAGAARANRGKASEVSGAAGQEIPFCLG